jgi:hypothetical protein
MNRKDIIKRLVKEGMTERTLANFSDKQIAALASRMLSEQTQTTVTKTTYNKNDPKQMAALNAKIGSVAKDPSKASTLKNVEVAESKKLSTKQKKVMDTDKDGDIDATDMKNLRNKKQSVDEKKPSAGLTAKKKSEVVKAAKAGKDIGKKGKGFEKIATKAAEKYGSAEKGKKVAAAAMWKNVKKESHEVGNWLNALVEMEYHPITSKKEILDLIRFKLNEQGPAIAEPEVAPEIAPYTEPDYDPNPDTDDEPFFDPWKTPGQNPDEAPKYEGDSEMPEFMKLDNLIRYYNQNK